jgi:hypothetical protein
MFKESTSSALISTRAVISKSVLVLYFHALEAFRDGHINGFAFCLMLKKSPFADIFETMRTFE